MATQESSNNETTITQLFGDVERLVNQEEYSKALRSIDKILQLNPTDNDSLYCKVITYIRLEKYQNALDLINKKFSNDDQLIFEKAYCLYRLNRLTDVIELLSKYHSKGNNDFGTRHLEAQVVQICKKSLTEEDYSEQEVEQELSTINVQLAYVYQLQGRISEAIEIYQSVLKLKSTDITVSAIASNNLVAANKDTELFDSARKIKVARSNVLETKLYKFQRRTIATNEALLLLYMHKYSTCQDAVRKLLQIYPENDDLYLILASTSYHQKKPTKTIQDLQEFIKSNPFSLYINFALIQLQILQSNPMTALSTLENYLLLIKDDSEKYKPGYVGLLVWLYEQVGKSEKAVQTLEKAGNFWKSGSDESTSILKQTAAFKLKTGRYQEAAKDYEQLVKNDPLNSQALAGLIIAYSHYNISLAEKYESSLPDINNININIDVESLEKIVPGVKKSYIKKTDTKSSEDPSKLTSNKNKKKKKRKPLLPKNYDQNVKPDPERWLPKYERSTYKAKGKRKQQLSKGPQGAAVSGGGGGTTGSANIFGKSNVSSSTSSENIVTSTTVQEQQQQQTPPKQTPPKSKSGGDKNKKKKKKGGNKW
ncbi:1728_t:CDS:2 [Diversispora eburnea]|uniref:Signal recognition particle subunit SRP72 n=1 Tax=Diversispora eburnea TaxID=1213867 RepID=A0A9N9BYA6_9GLOM|nr:1728_t:CDS:2 [Diversispora eburnea]